MLSLTVVLAASLYVDESEVRALIDRLGDERYSVRVEAQAQLEAFLLSAAGYRYRELVETAAQEQDLEIARRARGALASYYHVQPFDYPVLPWVDMLPPNFAERQLVIESCLVQVRPPGGWGYGADWPEYRQATAVLTRRLLDQGYPRHCVRQLLEDMVNQERQYREKHGMRDLASRN
jgi:hypothetical protein